MKGGCLMAVIFARKWWVWLLRGIAGILFGILAFFWPALTLEVLIFLIGIYLILDGILNTIAAIIYRKHAHQWWILFLEGLISIIIGIVIFIWPQLTAVALLYLIALWAIVTGIFEIIAAPWLRKFIEGEWLLAFTGILSVIFGFLLILWPGRGLLTLVWLIALYAVLYGISTIIFAFRLKALQATL
jgi:uncharacterized membrane protein HdeD (DUF308 family)